MKSERRAAPTNCQADILICGFRTGGTSSLASANAVVTDDHQLWEETFSVHPKWTQVEKLPGETLLSSSLKSHLLFTLPTFIESERKNNVRTAGWGQRSGGDADVQNAEGCDANALRIYESLLN